MSFFESISVASQERIHSQVLSWFFSSKCMATTEQNKLTLLDRIVGESLSSSEILRVTTEEDDIDIIVYTDNAIVAFENKIKSTTHSNQLWRYDKTLTAKKVSIVHKVYLSLYEEDIYNQNWKIITHLELCRLLSVFSFLDNDDAIIFKDYLKFYHKLGNAAFEFMKHPERFPKVFKDGSLKKDQKLDARYSSILEKFVCINQLETIFQKMFLKSLAQELGFKSDDYLVEETRGNALLNLYTDEFVINDKTFQLGLQLQRNSMKIIFQDKSYNKSNNKDLPEAVVNYFKKNLFFGGQKETLNMPRSRCYLSKSTTFLWGYELVDDGMDKLRNVLSVLKNKVAIEIKKLD
jgi:hypothetical protein